MITIFKTNFKENVVDQLSRLSVPTQHSRNKSAGVKVGAFICVGWLVIICGRCAP